VLVLAGLILLLANNPSHVFLQKIGDSTYLLFNRHYSYFSSQSTEMLRADYFDRLKVSNLYPCEWTRYHFFNSGARAASMGLIKEPGLFSYWIAQTIISVMILLSFAETFLINFGLRTRNIVILIAWTLIGFTFFSDSITWNFITTGLFSVFAMINLLIAIHFKHWREAVIFILILGASAFRLLPIALLLLAYLIYLLVKKNLHTNMKITLNDLYHFIKSKINLKALDFVALFLFIFYNALTILTAKNSPLEESSSLITKKLFDHGWSLALSFYKILGLSFWRVLHKTTYFNAFDSTGYFDKAFSSPLVIKCFIIILGILIFCALWSFIKIALQKRISLKWYILVGIIFCLEFSFLPLDLINLLILTLSYLLSSLLLLYLISNKKYDDDKITRSFVVFMIIGTFLFEHFGLPFSVKAPVSYITYDIALWGIVGIFLFTFSYKKRIVILSSIVAFIFVLSLHFTLLYMLRLPSIDSHSSRIDITQLVTTDFKRSNYVDENNFLTFRSDDSTTDDAYSAILGGNYYYSDKHSNFINNAFVQKENSNDK